MRPNDRDPFEDIFRELERFMDEMVGNVDRHSNVGPMRSTPGSSTHVDIHESEDEIRVVADLPGVEKSDISLQCDGEYVMISASSETREYDERVALPAPVDPETATATYNNGVLEITFERREVATDIDVE